MKFLKKLFKSEKKEQKTEKKQEKCISADKLTCIPAIKLAEMYHETTERLLAEKFKTKNFTMTPWCTLSKETRAFDTLVCDSVIAQIKRLDTK